MTIGGTEKGVGDHHQTVDQPGLDAGVRRALLDLAHRVVATVAAGATADRVPLGTAAAATGHAGAFVTLHRHGALRGCIGTFDTSQPLAETVREMAAAAALRDPRFPPLGVDELPDVRLSISVLTPPRPITGPADISIGRDGLEITLGRRRGVLLPQVAVEHGLSPDAFLAETCRKAGLPPNAWRDPAARLEAFSAEVFGDEAPERP